MKIHKTIYLWSVIEEEISNERTRKIKWKKRDEVWYTRSREEDYDVYKKRWWLMLSLQQTVCDTTKQDQKVWYTRDTTKPSPLQNKQQTTRADHKITRALPQNYKSLATKLQELTTKLQEPDHKTTRADQKKSFTWNICGDQTPEPFPLIEPFSDSLFWWSPVSAEHQYAYINKPISSLLKYATKLTQRQNKPFSNIPETPPMCRSVQGFQELEWRSSAIAPRQNKPLSVLSFFFSISVVLTCHVREELEGEYRTRRQQNKWKRIRGFLY